MPFDAVASVPALAEVIYPLVAVPPTPPVPPYVLSNVIDPGMVMAPTAKAAPADFWI